MGKLFRIWDETRGYAYLHEWRFAPPLIKEMITEYFCKNFDRLCVNKEWDALEWLANHASEFPEKNLVKYLGISAEARSKKEERAKYQKRALEFLSLNIEEVPPNIPLFKFIAARSNDANARNRAAERIGETRRAVEEKIRAKVFYF